jgi:hypothetical protein
MLRHPPAMPSEQFAHLSAEGLASAQENYRQRFEHRRDDLDRYEIACAVESMPLVDLMLLRAAFARRDDAEIGRIVANAITTVLCADAVAFAARQRALLQEKAA